jgi:tRNA threonylcarbamoyladenosine biosynthesis protein TsaB
MPSAMNLLCIETSSAKASIALRTASGIDERIIGEARDQTDLMLPYIDELLGTRALELGSLDGLVFGRGPGSFTGLRIAAAVVQGLATAARLPIVAVSSLQATAQHAWRAHAVRRALVCVDARMGEVYTAAFELEADVMRAASSEALVDARRVVAVLDGEWTLVGNGADVHADALAGLVASADRVLPDLLPTAMDLLPQGLREFEAGRVLTPQAAVPVYLRDESAWRAQR